MKNRAISRNRGWKDVKFLCVVIGFFVFLLLIGIYVHKDYGFPWDEVFALQFSRLTLFFINKIDQSLLTYPFKHLGPFSEIVLLAFSRSKLLLTEIHCRHLGIFISFIIGSITFLGVAKRAFQETIWALIPPAVLVISPRIFADSFYNSKDIPFFVSAIFWCWTLIKWDETLGKHENHRLCLIYGFFHAFATAASITTRIPGVVFFLITTIFILLRALHNQEQSGIYAKYFLYYILLSIGLTYLFWPVLWHDPIGEFVSAFRNMKQFPYTRDVFYLGQYYPPSSLPWHYMPVWIAISTPPLVVFGFLVGQIVLVVQAIRALITRSRNNLRELISYISKRRIWIVLISWLYLPVLAIYIFNSTLYDGWRHMFFIYPPIVIIAIYGIRSLWKWLSSLPIRNSIIKWAFVGLVVFGLAEPITFMVRNHPHENVYFNLLVGDRSQVRSRYDLDYWGLSYKQAVDYILEEDERDWFTIYAPTPAGLYYIQYMLPEHMRSRIGIVGSPYWADYFMSDYRWHSQDYPYQNKVYSIEVEGAEIMVVYKLRD